MTYFNCSGVEKPMVSFSEEACRARELDRSMAFIKGNCDWRLQLASSLQALQMMDEIRGGKILYLLEKFYKTFNVNKDSWV